MPAPIEPNPYLYFLYSTEQVTKRNEIEGNRGKKFQCGNVVISGKRKKFSYVGTSSGRDKFLKQYPDARQIAEGYKNKMTYEDCSLENKRGN